MEISDYKRIEDYMLLCMTDSTHDKEHIYRVLYTALDIEEHESGANSDILIAACLLHDIGRQDQFMDPSLCHAVVGAVKAYEFLMKNGFDANYAKEVAACIKSHRFRSENPPETIEAKILFDADKIDAAGTLGIARTIFYKGQMGEPLYSLHVNGEISDGSHDTIPSFFQEYKNKLEGLYSGFYTEKGREIARKRQQSAIAFYESMLNETKEIHQIGRRLLRDKFN